MKRRRHTPEQDVRKVREAERMRSAGRDLAEHHRCRAFAGMSAADARRLKEREAENAWPNRPLARRSLTRRCSRNWLSNNGDSGPQPGGGRAASEAVRVSRRRACAVVGWHRSTQRWTKAPPAAAEQHLRDLARYIPGRGGARRTRWRTLRCWPLGPSARGGSSEMKTCSSLPSAVPSAGGSPTGTATRLRARCPTTYGRWTSSSTRPPTRAASSCSKLSTSSSAKLSLSTPPTASLQTASVMAVE